MQRFKEEALRPLATVLLLVVVLLLPGCLFIAAGAATGAAVTYLYCKGKVCARYTANFADTWAATNTALTELSMPILKIEAGGTHGSIESQTADGESVSVAVDSEFVGSAVEPPFTVVCVRVGAFGERGLSVRIMDQISLHLAPITPVVQPVAANIPGTIVAVGATAPQSAPPPLNTMPQTNPPPQLPTTPIPINK